MCKYFFMVNMARGMASGCMHPTMMSCNMAAILQSIQSALAYNIENYCGSCVGGAVVSWSVELGFGSSGPGSSPGLGHCVVILGKTLDSHSVSLHPAV